MTSRSKTLPCMLEDKDVVVDRSTTSRDSRKRSKNRKKAFRNPFFIPFVTLFFSCRDFFLGMLSAMQLHVRHAMSSFAEPKRVFGCRAAACRANVVPGRESQWKMDGMRNRKELKNGGNEGTSGCMLYRLLTRFTPTTHGVLRTTETPPTPNYSPIRDPESNTGRREPKKQMIRKALWGNQRFLMRVLKYVCTR